MQFTYKNNTTYKIDFEYNNELRIEARNPRRGIWHRIEREVRVTTAYVYKIHNGVQTCEACGNSTCQPEDRFVKETGRTLSLREAVKSINDHQLRVKIFECYFNRKKQ